MTTTIIRTREQLETRKAEILAKYATNVDLLVASDLYNPDVEREVKDVLLVDLVARRCRN